MGFDFENQNSALPKQLHLKCFFILPISQKLSIFSHLKKYIKYPIDSRNHNCLARFFLSQKVASTTTTINNNFFLLQICHSLHFGQNNRDMMKGKRLEL